MTNRTAAEREAAEALALALQAAWERLAPGEQDALTRRFAAAVEAAERPRPVPSSIDDH